MSTPFLSGVCFCLASGLTKHTVSLCALTLVAEGGWTDTSVAREQAPYPQVISAPARGLLWGSDPAGCELPQGLQEARRLSVRLCSACQARILGEDYLPRGRVTSL